MPSYRDIILGNPQLGLPSGLVPRLQQALHGWQRRGGAPAADEGSLPLSRASTRAELAASSFVQREADAGARPNILELLLKGPGAASQAINVFHGSPHRFAPTAKNVLGEFNAGKIGTGEGAQAVAYGHYVAESPRVAGSYQRSGNGAFPVLKIGGRKVPDDADWIPDAGDFLEAQGSQFGTLSGSKAKELALSYVDNPKLKASLEALSPEQFELSLSRGNLYKADLADESLPKMLQIELPLEKQTAEVKKILERSGLVSGLGKNAGLTKGDAIYNRAVQMAGSPEAASAFLRDLGIPGVSYLDAGSRAAGAGSKNYVVFPGNEKLLKILERK